MDDKKKIVLGSEDFLAKGNEDIFININLQQKFNILKREKFDNNFDLAEQFRKERNASRSFRVYGIIDSPIINCDNLTIKVYAESNTLFGFQILGNQIATITSQPIGFGDKNVFGKHRGKYIIELNNYEISDTIWLEIQGDGVTYARIVIEQKLVFRDPDGKFIEYGTDSIDIGINGGFEVVQNDFPFFYNKHWIKNNFQVEKVKIRNIRFAQSAYYLDEGESGVVTVQLTEPSVFGTESVTVNLVSPSGDAYNTAVLGTDFSVDNFPFTFPMNLNWSVGQQSMDIDITALSDFIIEKNEEKFSLSLDNPINATTDAGVVNIETTTVSIKDLTPKVYVKYNFQKIINNINPITDPLIFPENLGQFPSFQMNTFGAKDGVGSPTIVNNNFRFFPNDTFEVTITNQGDETTLPVIPGVTTQEQYFGAGDSITLSVDTKYVNHDSLPREVAVFEFREKDTGGIFGGGSYYTDFFYVNGLKVGQTPLVADNFVEKLNQKYSQVGMVPSFTIEQTFKTVTLTAKHPATNVNGFIPQDNGFFPGTGDYALQGFNQTPNYPNGRVSTITDQIPFELKLYANDNNATTCRYSFDIKKQGFKDVFVPATNIAANTSGTNAYLVTPIKDVSGPSLPAVDPAVCNVFSNTLDADGYYLNGVALLASGVFNSEEATATNTHSSGYLPSFRLAPLTSSVITCNNLIGISKVLS
jgi:hypothetical protein